MREVAHGVEEIGLRVGITDFGIGFGRSTGLLQLDVNKVSSLFGVYRTTGTADNGKISKGH